MSWFVLYTKPRNEKKVAATLTERNYSVYCPVTEEVRQWSDRRKKVTEPLFKSYIFINLTDYHAQCAEVLQTPGTVRFLWWSGKPGIVRDNEIKAIQDFLNAYKGADIIVSVERGQEVTIQEGPLKDKTGVVYQVKGNKAYLHIQSLGMDLVAQVPVQQLKLKK